MVINRNDNERFARTFVKKFLLNFHPNFCPIFQRVHIMVTKFPLLIVITPLARTDKNRSLIPISFQTKLLVIPISNCLACQIIVEILSALIPVATGGVYYRDMVCSRTPGIKTDPTVEVLANITEES